MRLTFSTNNYLNSVLSNDQGQQLYTISTSGCFNSKTTITKHGQCGDDDIIGVITWHTFEDTTLWLKATGSEVAAKSLLQSKLFSSNRTFTAPDGKTYVWNIRKTNCTLKVKGTNLQLVKYHKRNMGIMSPSHPPYLEISPSVYHILDVLLVTFIYAEKMSKKEEQARAAAAAG
ncbi:hypothetical protein EDD16DRAFT_1710556 [Pisolithus croceorrhizus]|nr:hypothetical protein EV401DRAFT_1891574 [Pisolithus croceorrhizus]KAI6110888.1 hypothetical protein EDD16DRAFT_1710556 [Pisolithus croceorrhizus]